MFFPLPSEDSTAFSAFSVVINVLSGEERAILLSMGEETLLELAIKVCRCGDLVNTVRLLSDDWGVHV